MRTRFDEVVQPVDGPHPTSALRGASNLVVQDVCPGRRTGHAGLAVDSVSFAALLDAIGHQGSARASRLPASVCAKPFATDLPEQKVRDAIAALTAQAMMNLAAAPTLATEPAAACGAPRAQHLSATEADAAAHGRKGAAAELAAASHRRQAPSLDTRRSVAA